MARAAGQGTEELASLSHIHATALQPHSPAPSMPGGGSQGELLAQGPVPHTPVCQWNVPLHSLSTRQSQGQAAQTTGWSCLRLGVCMGSPVMAVPLFSFP